MSEDIGLPSVKLAVVSKSTTKKIFIAHITCLISDFFQDLSFQSIFNNNLGGKQRN